MASWTELSRDSLDAAKALKEKGHVRSSLSRAYYSVYALLTGELAAAGHTVSTGGRPNPSHEQLVTLARHNLDPGRFDDQGRRVISRHVRRLLSLRVAADYDPESSLDESDAVLALRAASDVHKALEI